MPRTRKTSDRRNQLDGNKPPANSNLELTIPSHFRCPISLDLMKDPVTLCTGITYDRQSIDTWLDAGNYTCPVTNQILNTFEQIPNHTLRRMIQDWCVDNRSFGIERIPTPRIPLTDSDVSAILAEVATASRRRDYPKCRDLVKKINALIKESDRNRRCIVRSEMGRVLSAAFETFASASPDNHAAGLEEILSLLTWMFPLDEAARLSLGSHPSLFCLSWFLKCGTLAGRRNAVLAIKDIASSNQRHVEALAQTNGLIESLVKIIKTPICPAATKAALMTVHYLISSSPSKKETAEQFVDMGLVALLLEKLVDSEKSICEKALAVLDGICGCDRAREIAYGHALTVPILVKKIFRVSDLATGFAVSALWKLLKNQKGECGEILVECLQVGAFQKVLMLLQVGCEERTKEKATDLLKLLNGSRGSGECIDSLDFKQLKRSF
ncbi:U-box domain-containing protein 21-like [Magnolia sinica]|uniref:U-box domain-containing protein 21-like n=1 Tax=Magnolia sinica TaxID=86752 RepID=UPI002657CEDB|nr:U-box domain-containing protein 21-like [Magnolia sinica]